MALTVEEWNDLVNDAIKAPEDNAKVLSVLTQARDAYVDLFAERTAAGKAEEVLREENERLKKTNMELFLRIGQQTANSTGSDNGADSEVDRSETITIADLFKEDDR